MTPLYTLEDLRYRPVEHILEELSCVKLGRLLGVNRSWAHCIKRGEVRLEDEQVRRLRRELEK